MSNQEIREAVDAGQELPATLVDAREAAIAKVLAVFADSDPAKALRHVAHAAFMQGAWVSHAFETQALIDLADRDRAEVLALAADHRATREAGQ